MTYANSLVLLDLKNLDFLESLFALEKHDKIQLLQSAWQLTWADVQRDPGLKWEKIHPAPVLLQRHLLDDKQRPMYSIRLTHRNVRLCCGRATTFGSSRCRKITNRRLRELVTTLKLFVENSNFRR